MAVGRYLTERLCNPGSDRALVFCTPHTPSRHGWRGQQQRGLNRPQPVVLRQRVPPGVKAVLVIGVIVAVGEEGVTARRLAELLVGVRSTMIKAGRDREGWTRLQRGQEEEESGSVGGQDRDGVPGAGSELGRGGQWRRPGTGQPLGGCHPVAFQRGQGVSSPAPRQLSRTRGRRWLRPWGLVAE